MRVARVILLAVSAALVLAAVASAVVHRPREINSDRYRNTDSQHTTNVEPDSYAWGNTIVVTSQTGRFTNGGGSNVAWTTSTDGGFTWTKGALPGTTVFENGPWSRVSDPAVAYDARHGVWMISTLAIQGTRGAGVLTSRSTDGGLTWQNPVTVALSPSTFFDKNWIACDNWSQSPFYGNCYTEWDDNGLGNRLLMSTSTDGGLTWGPMLSPAGTPSGLGGQPVAQPDGTVVVPYSGNFGSIRAFRSTDGGASWTSTVLVSTQSTHNVAGGLRDPPLPSAEVDGSGRVFVVWHGCQFRSGCSANDIVMSTSTDGVTWTPLARIPIDPVTSGIDHFIPGVGVDTDSARVAVTYYYYPVSSCSFSTCELHVGFISSSDGGQTWHPPITLAGPMNLAWIANTTQGRMVGDYISTSFIGDDAHAVYVAAKPLAPPNNRFDEGTYSAGIAVPAGVRGKPVGRAKPKARPAAPWQFRSSYRPTAN